MAANWYLYKVSTTNSKNTCLTFLDKEPTVINVFGTMEVKAESGVTKGFLVITGDKAEVYQSFVGKELESLRDKEIDADGWFI